MNKTIYPLTSVRFFAASLVLIHHSVGIFLPAFSAKEAHLARGDIAGILSLAFPVSVSFFFLLSGYVLSYVYLHDGQTVDKSKFFAARLARLYPLYFVMLILDTPKLLAGEVERHGMKLGLPPSWHRRPARCPLKISPHEQRVPTLPLDLGDGADGHVAHPDPGILFDVVDVG